MEKGTRVEQIRAATTRLRREGIEVGFFLQFGYPGETDEDIELTLQMVRDCRPDDIGVSVSYPLPGTPFFERVKTLLGAKQNWVDSDDLAMMYPATYPPEFYRTLHAAVHAEFRARKSLDAIASLARRPRTMGRRTARIVLSGMYHALRLPGWRRTMKRLVQQSRPAPSISLTPALSQQAAATPSEQPQ
jgi:radical SAM superfamily enzyme YgiQ (UPF0313 family)